MGFIVWVTPALLTFLGHALIWGVTRFLFNRFCPSPPSPSSEFNTSILSLTLSCCFSLSLSFTLEVFDVISEMYRICIWGLDFGVLLVVTNVITPVRYIHLIVNSSTGKSHYIGRRLFLLSLLLLSVTYPSLLAFYYLNIPLLSLHLQDQLTRLGLCGVFVVSGLSGFGSIEYPTQTLALVIQPVSDEHIKTVQRNIKGINEVLYSRKLKLAEYNGRSIEDGDGYDPDGVGKDTYGTEKEEKERGGRGRLLRKLFAMIKLPTPSLLFPRKLDKTSNTRDAQQRLNDLSVGPVGGSSRPAQRIRPQKSTEGGATVRKGSNDAYVVQIGNNSNDNNIVNSTNYRTGVATPTGSNRDVSIYNISDFNNSVEHYPTRRRSDDSILTDSSNLFVTPALPNYKDEYNFNSDTSFSETGGINPYMGGLMRGQMKKEKNIGSNNQSIVERERLEEEVEMCEMLRDMSQSELTHLISCRSSLQQSLTFRGKVANGFGWLMTSVCIYRIFMSSFNIYTQRVSMTDPSTAILQFVLNRLGIMVDIKFWTPHLSLLLMGLIIVLTIRGIVDRLSLALRSIQSSPWLVDCLSILLTQLVAIYFAAFVMLFRVYLPEEKRTHITSFLGPLQFEFFHLQFDFIFVASSVISCLALGTMYIYKKQRLKDIIDF